MDLLVQTAHDRFTTADLQRLQPFGIHTVRTAARWYLIESQPQHYNFDTLLPALHAADRTGTEILLDFLHFGWPDHLDIFHPSFADRFTAYVRATVDFLAPYRHIVTAVSPVNEISFLSWAAGDVGAIFPGSVGRGDELKRILVRCAVLACESILAAWPDARLLSPEPVIHIVENPLRLADDEAAAAAYSLAQYQAWDMLSGRIAPELGGRPEYLGILGLNFYARNQWVNFGETLPRSDPRFKPFSVMLAEVYERYQRPLFVSETGTEDDDRAGWFRYVCEEVRLAQQSGIPVHGICLYPIANHPGWADDRHCHNGLFDYCDAHGYRPVYQPLADAIHAEQQFLSQSQSTMTSHTAPDLLCLSHLRWGFVYQRPQHLMTRFARSQRVFYFEEPVWEQVPNPYVRTHVCPDSGVRILVPVLTEGASYSPATLRDLLAAALRQHNIQHYVAWYYTPMAMEFTSHLDPLVTIYDCMDELSAFDGAPPAMRANEEALLRSADLVFTGGASLYRSKRTLHPSVHLFPSSIDAAHFEKARSHRGAEPADQTSIGRPRIGYSGVIDERMDLALLRSIAALRPDWQFILLGPVVKIDSALLPQAPNLHYLGMKTYSDLPAYLSGWTIGMLPFALNESTRFISPTKTPEYLAAGLRVVSTHINDVADTYGALGLASIVRTPQNFITAVESLLAEGRPYEFEEQVRHLLETSSWDRTWQSMQSLIRSYLSTAPTAVSTPTHA